VRVSATLWTCALCEAARWERGWSEVWLTRGEANGERGGGEVGRLESLGSAQPEAPIHRRQAGGWKGGRRVTHGACSTTQRLARGEAARQPQVDGLEHGVVALAVEEEVVRLDVAQHHALEVAVSQRAQHLLRPSRTS
jgi:hypothetical protein